MSAPVEALFQPFRLGALELPTRVVMAPMTRNFPPAAYPTPRSSSTTAGAPPPASA